jgi:hypothetical protein
LKEALELWLEIYFYNRINNYLKWVKK